MPAVDLDRIMGRMSLDDMIAQLFLSGIVAEESLEQVRAYMTENHFGGYSLSYNFARFLRGGSYHVCGIGRQVPIGETAEFLHRVKELSWEIMGVPAICTLDQEGGMEESEFRRSPVVLTPNQMGVAANGSARDARATAYLSASQLKALGVDMLLGACLDVNSNPLNPEIAHRALGDDPATVAKLGAQVLRGYHDAGLFCTAKHFPGRGNAAGNAHADLDILTMDRAHYDRVEFPPFRAAIAAGVDLVMLSHTIYPALGDDRLPASMSPVIINDVLRGELGFTGLVYTDDISMLAISNRWGVPTACAMAFAAGNDMILMKVNKELTPAVQETRRFIREGKLTEADIAAKCRRVLELKARYGMFERPPFSPATVAEKVGTPAQIRTGRRLARRAALCLKNADGFFPLRPAAYRHPLVIAVRDRSVSVANDPDRSHDLLLRSVQRRFPGARGTIIDQEPSRDQVWELEGLCKNSDLVIFQLVSVRSGEASVGAEQGLLGALAAVVGHGRPVAVVITGAPYVAARLPAAVRGICCAFGVTPLTMEAAVDLMCGRIPQHAKLPVDIDSTLRRGYRVEVPRA
jgi:beta-N-acetylhexosaminidase